MQCTKKTVSLTSFAPFRHIPTRDLKMHHILFFVYSICQLNTNLFSSLSPFRYVLFYLFMCAVKNKFLTYMRVYFSLFKISWKFVFHWSSHHRILLIHWCELKNCLILMRTFFTTFFNLDAYTQCKILNNNLLCIKTVVEKKTFEKS